MAIESVLLSENCWRIFGQSTDDYHVADNVDQEMKNPFQEGTLEALLYWKNWIDAVQWHLEDLIREPNLEGARVKELKTRIDKSNQLRTDVVEKLDDWVIEHFKAVKVQDNARLNTESPAWVLDRMSILVLKIYHMREQVGREGVDEAHKQKCQAKFDVLMEQQGDLSGSYDDLMGDIGNGLKKVKVYRQMKMYNDAALNPVLYKEKSKSTTL